MDHHHAAEGGVPEGQNRVVGMSIRAERVMGR